MANQAQLQAASILTARAKSKGQTKDQLESSLFAMGLTPSVVSEYSNSFGGGNSLGTIKGVEITESNISAVEKMFEMQAKYGDGAASSNAGGLSFAAKDATEEIKVKEFQDSQFQEVEGLFALEETLRAGKEIEFAAFGADGKSPNRGFEGFVGAKNITKGVLPFGFAIGGTSGADFKSQYENYKNRLTLEAREQLEGQGQITEGETAMLTRAEALTDDTQSQEEFGRKIKIANGDLELAVQRKKSDLANKGLIRLNDDGTFTRIERGEAQSTQGNSIGSAITDPRLQFALDNPTTQKRRDYIEAQGYDVNTGKKKVDDGNSGLGFSTAITNNGQNQQQQEPGFISKSAQFIGDNLGGAQIGDAIAEVIVNNFELGDTSNAEALNSQVRQTAQQKLQSGEMTQQEFDELNTVIDEGMDGIYDYDGPNARQIISDTAKAALNSNPVGIGRTLGLKALVAGTQRLGALKGGLAVGAAEGFLDAGTDDNNLADTLKKTFGGAVTGGVLGVVGKVGINKFTEFVQSRRNSKTELDELAQKVASKVDDPDIQDTTKADVESQVKIEEDLDTQLDELSKSGSITEEKLAPFKIVKNSDGTVSQVKDASAKKAVKRGVAPSDVSLLNNASEADRSLYRSAFQFMQKKQEDPAFGDREGIDLYGFVGERIKKQETYLDNKLSADRLELDRVATGLENAPMPDRNKIAEKINSDLIGIDADLVDGKVSLIGSQIEGANGKALDLSYQKIISAANPKELHEAKRFIDKQITTQIGNQTLNGDVQRILLGWRKEINDGIRSISEDYTKVNDRMSTALGAKKAMAKVLGKSYDETADGFKNIRLGQAAKQFMTENTGRARAMTAVARYEEAAKDLGMKVEGDIYHAARGLAAIRDAFPEVQKENLASKFTKGIKDGGADLALDIATGNAAGLGTKAFGLVKGVFSRNGDKSKYYEKQQEAISNILKEKDFGKGFLETLKNTATSKTQKGSLGVGAIAEDTGDFLKALGKSSGVREKKITDFSRALDSDQIVAMKKYIDLKERSKAISVKDNGIVLDLIKEFNISKNPSDKKILEVVKRLVDVRDADIIEKNAAAKGGTATSDTVERAEDLNESFQNAINSPKTNIRDDAKLAEQAKKFDQAEKFIRKAGDPERWTLDKEARIPDELYRGVSDSSGEGFAIYGQGLYTAANKKEALKYGDVSALDKSSAPSNPIQFESRLDFSQWEHEIAKRYGLRSKRDLYATDTGPDQLIKSMGYDGVTIGKGKDMILVKFDGKKSSYSPPPTVEELREIYNKANKN